MQRLRLADEHGECRTLDVQDQALLVELSDVGELGVAWRGGE